MLILLAAFALQQRECIVRLSPSPSPSRSPFCIFFLGSSSATDHKRKVLKSLLSIHQIKVKVMHLLYIIYKVPLTLFPCFSPTLALFNSIYLYLSMYASLYSLSFSPALTGFLSLSPPLYLPSSASSSPRHAHH